MAILGNGLLGNSVDYSDGATAIANLLAYWKLIETTGNAADSSGNGYTGASSNITWNAVAGAGASMGNAPSLSGTNSFFDLAVALRSAWTPAEFSVSMWIKNADWASATARGAIHFTVNTSNRMWMRKSAANAFQWEYDAGGTAKAVSKTSVSDAGWIQVGMTVKKADDAFKAYWNGVQQGATVTGLGTWSGTPVEMTIGLRASDYWSGNLHHVAVYNRALTDAEMLLLGTAI